MLPYVAGSRAVVMNAAAIPGKLAQGGEAGFSQAN